MDFGALTNNGQISWPTSRHQTSPLNTAVVYSYQSSPQATTAGSFLAPPNIFPVPTSTYHPTNLAAPDVSATTSHYPAGALYPAASPYPGAATYPAGPAPPFLAAAYPFSSQQPSQPQWTHVSR